jgi:hypothetical protein
MVPTRKHHTIPKCKNGKETVDACIVCESYIHSTWSHSELENVYNTVESILQTEQFKKFLKWRLKQPVTVLFKSDRGKFRDKNKYH